jgi:hypothetical protein
MADQGTLGELSKERKVGGPWTLSGVTLKRAGDVEEVGSKGFKKAECIFVDEQLNMLDVQWGYPPANLAQLVGQSGTLLVKGEEFGGRFRYGCKGDDAFPAGEEKKFGGGKGGGWQKPEWKPSREITGSTAQQMVGLIGGAYAAFTGKHKMSEENAAKAAVAVGIAFADGKVWPEPRAAKPVAAPPPHTDDDIPF